MFVDYWQDIAFQCYRKYELLVDKLALIRDHENSKKNLLGILELNKNN